MQQGATSTSLTWETTEGTCLASLQEPDQEVLASCPHPGLPSHQARLSLCSSPNQRRGTTTSVLSRRQGLPTCLRDNVPFQSRALDVFNEAQIPLDNALASVGPPAPTTRPGLPRKNRHGQIGIRVQEVIVTFEMHADQKQLPSFVKPFVLLLFPCSQPLLRLLMYLCTGGRGDRTGFSKQVVEAVSH